jgi:hypothetical protein
MSYFEFRQDMSECNFSSDQDISVLNVGWLSSSVSYTTGNIYDDFIKKLRRLVVNSESSPFKPIVWRSRGQDSCPLCLLRDFVLEDNENTEILGSSEFFIPCYSKKNSYFISPSLIYHFIADHNYLPPEQFINSVMAINENCQFDGENIYMSAQGLGEFIE